MSACVPLHPGPAAVLFDRDGTLLEDVPYIADPRQVRPVRGAGAAVERLRSRGVRTGVLTSQSGVSRGLVSLSQLRRVHRRVDELLGPFDIWQVCVHSTGDGCRCRPPAAGLVADACQRLGVPPARCVVIGDTAADITAAHAAGAVGVLVPTTGTRPDDIAAVPCVATDLSAAIDWVLGGTLLPAASDARLAAGPSGLNVIGAGTAIAAGRRSW